MVVEVAPSKISGIISAIPSKAAAHRILICSALGTKSVFVKCGKSSEDIDATIGCLNSLGANIEPVNGGYNVTPINTPIKNAVLDCKESGTTLRFMLPVVAALGSSARLIRRGRLASRPIGELAVELIRMGANVYEKGDTIFVYGKLKPGDYRMRGDISSQYISGLLLAMPMLAGTSRLFIDVKLESRPYVELTKSIQENFDIKYSLDSDVITIKNTNYTPYLETLEVEGDWSNSAFWLTAGALNGSITVTGLNINSSQGDRQILDILRNMGASVSISQNSITVSHRSLKSVDIDATHIPDLVPILSIISAVAEGNTNIHSAHRLRLKESNRLSAITDLISRLHGNISEKEDGLFIKGIYSLNGGRVSSFSDHRIAMSATIASIVSKDNIIIEGAEAVSKSYPQFFDDFRSLGGSIIFSQG